MNKVAIIQARMSSSRLPGKVMLDIAGKPMLLHVIERARLARQVDQVVLATSNDPSDDILEQFCQTNALPYYRGSLPDVLDRFYQAATQFQADVIIRLTADCPLLDHDVIDRTISVYLGNSPASDTSLDSLTDHHFLQPIDFAANRLPPPWQRTLPIGLDVEVCSFGALQRAWIEASQPYHREHVMPYLYEGVVFAKQALSAGDEWYIQHSTTPRGFKVALLNHFPDHGALRWTVDTPADLEFVRRVYTYFDGQAGFGWQRVLELLRTEPELAFINNEVRHKTAFDVDKRTL